MPLHHSVRALTVLALVVAGTALPATADAASRPDLVVSSLHLGAKHVQRGASVGLAETTQNVGAKAAGPSTTSYYLSKDRSRSGGDRTLGSRKVKGLKAHKSASTSRRIAIPAGVATGSWYLLACADSGGKVTEKSERNNCRSAPLGVTAPATSGPLSVTPALADTSTAEWAFGDNDPTDDKPSDPASTITAVHAGVTYTLSVPAHALNRTVRVTMTPLAGVAGAPMSGGFLGGVKIEPTGVELNELATLTITPADPPDWGRVTGFRFFDAGDDFGMIPLDQAHSPSGAVAVPVGELATYALADTTPADRSMVLAHPPVRPEGAHLSRLANLVRQGAPRAVPTRPSSVVDVVPTLAEENHYYDSTVKPALQAATTNDAKAPQAVQQAFAWLHEMAVLGITEGMTQREQEAFNLIHQVMVFAGDAAYARCQEHNLADLARLVGFARWFAILGDEPNAQKYFDDATRCGKFEVRFDDDLTLSAHFGDNSGYHFDLDAHWTLHAVVPIGIWSSGQVRAPLKESTFSYDETVTEPRGGELPPCHATMTGNPPAQDGTAIAYLSLDLRPNNQDPKVPGPPLRDGILQLSAGGAGLDPTEPHSGGGDCGFQPNYEPWSQFYHYDNPYNLGQIPIPRATQNAAIVLQYDPDTWTGDFDTGGNYLTTDHTHVTVLHVPE